MNFLDYMKKHGNKPFEKYKFNELDGLVFAAFAYIRFERVFKNRRSIPIKDIVSKFASFDKKARIKYYMFENDEKLINQVKNSPRYYDIDVIDNYTYFDKETSTQFFAYTSRLTKNEIVVSYRGTDETLLGWQEAFKLGFADYVYGRDMAKQYLLEIIERYPNDKIYVVGHSKGGHFAMFAVAALEFKYQRNVSRVYNYDGPSMLEKTKEKLNFEDAKNKITTFLPKASVVGISLGNEERCKIVDSDLISFAQHVYYFWKVEENHFKYINKRTRNSLAFEKSFGAWLSAMTMEQVSTYTKFIFDWLDKAKIRNVEDFVNLKKISNLFSVIGNEKNQKKKIFGIEVLRLFKMYVQECIKLGGK